MSLNLRGLGPVWITAIMVRAAAGAGEPTEQNPASFKGTIGTTSADSKPDWPTRTEPPEGSPNVLIWVIDDAGFAHLYSYSGLIDTPTTDMLAKEGLRYSNFHTTAMGVLPPEAGGLREHLRAERGDHGARRFRRRRRGVGGRASWLQCSRA